VLGAGVYLAVLAKIFSEQQAIGYPSVLVEGERG
jgi:hypothetical protein